MNVLITGHTRGLGAALMHACAGGGHTVYGIARGRHASPPAALHEAAIDLGAPHTVAAPLTTLLEDLSTLGLVILNAGMLGPIAPLTATSLDELRHVMDVNVWANKVIIDTLVALDLAPAQLVFVSSGAGVRGHYGWGAYALSKATLNMLAQLYAHELPQTHVTALAPGLVDTDMQVALRGVDANAFPSVARLHEAAGTAAMPEPAMAAANIIAALEPLRQRPSGEFVDLRNF